MKKPWIGSPRSNTKGLLKTAHLLRCAASFVVATYAKVRLTPHNLRALHLSIFEQPMDIVI